MGYGLGFACPGARQDEQRPLGFEDSFLLFIVKGFEVVHGAILAHKSDWGLRVDSKVDGFVPSGILTGH